MQAFGVRTFLFLVKISRKNSRVLKYFFIKTYKNGNPLLHPAKISGILRIGKMSMRQSGSVTSPQTYIGATSTYTMAQPGHTAPPLYSIFACLTSGKWLFLRWVFLGFLGLLFPCAVWVIYNLHGVFVFPCSAGWPAYVRLSPALQ